MDSSRTSWWLAVVAVVALAPASAGADCVAESGVGGTGLTAPSTGGTGVRGDEGSGAGGTGLSGSGVGGTGLQGDEGSGVGGTGVFGTITNFGSICVNGLEIEYGNDTPVERDGRNVSTKELRIGQVVQVRTRGDAALRADHIRVETALGGPIERVDRGSRQITVMGQTVVLRPDARVVDGSNRPTEVETLSAGDRVSVSGMRRSDGSIEASRVAPRGTGEPDIATGRSVEVGGGTVYVGDLRGALAQSARDVSGARAELRGRWNASTRTLDDASLRATPIRSAGVRDLSVEGFADRSQGGLSVHGIDVDTRSLPESERRVEHGQRIVVRGRFDQEGRLRAQRIAITGRDTRPLGRSDADIDDRSDREDREDRSGRRERSDREDRSGRSERPERAERPERSERPERAERSGRQ